MLNQDMLEAATKQLHLTGLSPDFLELGIKCQKATKTCANMRIQQANR
jgi:hypothetical protein